MIQECGRDVVIDEPGLLTQRLERSLPRLKQPVQIVFTGFGVGTNRSRLAQLDIVNQKMDIEVMSYDPDSDKVVPKRIVNWFDNGRTDEFLQFDASYELSFVGAPMVGRAV